jgi:hypothetical protein
VNALLLLLLLLFLLLLFSHHPTLGRHRVPFPRRHLVLAASVPVRIGVEDE